MNRSSDTRRWATVLTAAVLMAVTGTVAPIGVASADDPGAAVLASETRLVAGGPGNQTNPHLSGGLLVFTAAETLTAETRYVDLAAGTESPVPIPNAGHRDEMPDVSGSLVVFRRIYTDGSSSTRPIMVFDVAAPGLGARELAPEEGARRRLPTIGGTTVAFMEEGGGLTSTTDVCVADASTIGAPAVCLTSDGDVLSNRDPAVSPDGTTVAFAKCAPNGAACDIYVARRAADGSWESPRQLTGPAGQDIQPDTDGTVVTYSSDAGGDFDIWWENVDGTSEGQLMLTDAPGSDEGNARLSGGAITFERELPGSSDADLYLYRPSTEQLDRLTDTPADETLNAVSLSPTGELRVAWARSDGLTLGHRDIYALRAQLTSGGNSPPVLQVPADLTVDATGPDGAAVTYAVGVTDDGAVRSVACDPASGSPFAIGTTTVTCTAIDDDGAAGAASFLVTVRGAGDQLADLLVAVAGVGPGNSLAAKIGTAVGHLPDRALPLTCEPLRAFVKEVRAQSGKRIPAEVALALIEDATRIRAVLGCR